jgi:hypothetical protein
VTQALGVIGVFAGESFGTFNNKLVVLCDVGGPAVIAAAVVGVALWANGGLGDRPSGVRKVGGIQWDRPATPEPTELQ